MATAAAVAKSQSPFTATAEVSVVRRGILGTLPTIERTVAFFLLPRPEICLLPWKEEKIALAPDDPTDPYSYRFLRNLHG
jgi:hypothetical protein